MKKNHEVNRLTFEIVSLREDVRQGLLSLDETSKKLGMSEIRAPENAVEIDMFLVRDILTV